MVQRVQSIRSSIAGNRPPAGTRQPGELYTNWPDNAFGVINAAQSPVDLLAVRFFSALASYNIGDFVQQGGQLYQANAAITPAAFNATQWNKVGITGDAQPNYVLKAGDTMTGALTLPGNPTLALQAAPKQYVDNAVTPYLLKSGGTMTGILTLSGAPAGVNDAATKQYVDNAVVPYLPKAGGTMTGVLTLNADPAGTNDAATKHYVDTQVATVGGPGSVTHIGGRLTLDSANAVMTQAGVTASPNVYWSPYQGNMVPVWNGTTFQMQAVPQLTNVLANSAVGNAGPAATVAATGYDLFIWSPSAGTYALTRGPAWSSFTARALALNLVSSVLVNAAAITNGPAAGYGVFVGSIFTDASTGNCTFLPYSGSANAATMCRIGVWNNYNRVDLSTAIWDTNTSHTYGTNTWRQWAGVSASMQTVIMRGLDEDGVVAAWPVTMNTPASTYGEVAVYLDGVLAGYGWLSSGSTAQMTGVVPCRYSGKPGLGMHYFNGYEMSGAASTTYYSNNQLSVFNVETRY